MHLDPYELHKRIRYYETQYQLKEHELINLYKEHKTLKGYLEILGITKKDLKKSVATGKLNLNSFNSEIFKLHYKTKKMQRDAVHSVNGSKKDYIRNKSSRGYEKRREFRRMIRPSKSTIDVHDTKQPHIEIEPFSGASSNTGSENEDVSTVKKESKFLEVEKRIENIHSINDFGKQEPSSNVDILLHLEKIKEAAQKKEVVKSSNQS